jgi:hypothetical protein
MCEFREEIAGEYPRPAKELYITEKSKIDVPIQECQVNFERPENLMRETKFMRPIAGPYDLSKTYSFKDNWCLSFYSDNISEGLYSITHPENKCHISVKFNKDQFKALCPWLIYGGVRGLYRIMSELFTGWPVNLKNAISANRHNTPAPGERHSYSLEYQTGGLI